MQSYGIWNAKKGQDGLFGDGKNQSNCHSSMRESSKIWARVGIGDRKCISFLSVGSTQGGYFDARKKMKLSRILVGLRDEQKVSSVSRSQMHFSALSRGPGRKKLPVGSAKETKRGRTIFRKNVVQNCIREKEREGEQVAQSAIRWEKNEGNFELLPDTWGLPESFSIKQGNR